MSQYTDFEAVLVNGIKYKLARDLIWHIGKVDGPEYVVPAGCEFDVSIPKFLRWLFNPHEKAFHKAAALHDHMLMYGWNRVSAAAEFHQALKADKVKWFRRLLMLLAVILYKYD